MVLNCMSSLTVAANAPGVKPLKGDVALHCFIFSLTLGLLCYLPPFRLMGKGMKSHRGDWRSGLPGNALST